MAIKKSAYNLTSNEYIRFGVYRANNLADDPDAHKIIEDNKMAWTSWVDPDDDRVAFHRTACYGSLWLEE